MGLTGMGVSSYCAHEALSRCSVVSSGGGLGRWDADPAPSSLHEQPLPLAPRAGTGQRGNPPQGAEAARLSRGEQKQQTGFLLTFPLPWLLRVPRSWCCPGGRPSGSCCRNVRSGELCKYSRLKTGKVTDDLYLLQMFPMFCSIVLLINKNQPKTKKATWHRVCDLEQAAHVHLLIKRGWYLSREELPPTPSFTPSQGTLGWVTTGDPIIGVSPHSVADHAGTGAGLESSSQTVQVKIWGDGYFKAVH